MSGEEVNDRADAGATGMEDSKPARTWRDVTLDDVYAARERIMTYLHRTPILSSHTLSRMSHTNIGLKAEVLQKTGSFKARGAVNAAMQLTDEQKARGIVTLSAGNHGQGIAFGAGLVGSRAVVFMPQTAVPTKVEAIQNYGAEVKFSPHMEGIYPIMEAYQNEHGLTYISPYNDPQIVAGQGTIGLEILEDVPDVEVVVVPVGGGGLLAGIALAIKSLRPDVRVIGVEPEGANIVKRSLESGKLEVGTHLETVADGLQAPEAGDLTQALIQHYVDDVVLVSDDEIVYALRLILSRRKVLTEPAGAAATAALLSGKASVPTGARTVSILSGGNIDEAKLISCLQWKL